jgi:hypothetical protein
LAKPKKKSQPKKVESVPVEEKKKRMSHHEYAVMSERSKKFDPNATADDCIKDLRALQDEFPHKAITRNFYRVNGTYSDATWNQYMGTFHEFRRAAGLELSRDQHSFERKIAKHASLDTYRKFYQAEVLPYHGKFNSQEDKTGRWKTILVGSDFHDLECDPFMQAVFIDTAHRLQPDIIVLNGDVFDNYEFSRFDKDPRQVEILERFRYVKIHIFGALRRACPNAQIELVAGNHEVRILKLLADKTPALKVLLADVMGLTFSDLLGLDEFEINLTCKMDLAAFSQPDITDEVKENFKCFFDAFVCSHYKSMKYGMSGTSGHTHHPEQVTFVNIPMGKLSWTNTGCMSQTRMEYTDGMDDAMNSFMIAHIDTHLKRVAPEHFVVPGDNVVVHGKRYVREGSLLCPAK